MVYLIAYDLHAPGRGYSTVTEVVEQSGSGNRIHPQGSVWLVDTPHSADDWAKALNQATDTNDEIFVARLVTHGWASFAMDADSVAWLKSASRSW